MPDAPIAGSGHCGNALKHGITRCRTIRSRLPGFWQTGFRAIIPLLFLTMTLAVSGCIDRLNRRVDPVEYAAGIASEAGLQEHQVQSGQFTVQTWSRPPLAGKDLIVYLEGDGHAFDRYGATDDPTPAYPIGLELAANDRSGDNLLYIARPCQYVMRTIGRGSCRQEFWTTERYAPVIINAIKNSIVTFHRKIEDQTGTEAVRIKLVGYSGGGAIALILAAGMLPEVHAVITVAGNVDPDGINRFHKIKERARAEQAEKSLTPMDYISELRSVPQIHFVGEDDHIVPPSITEVLQG